MAKINVLPKHISELIAAGEVVERPSSAIKELVENSIDAGAKAITVEIMNGGVKFIRVTDNGCGIQREDVKTAFLRHATSKVLKENDLNSISTLGFRGEALAAISAVSRVEMLTKTDKEEFGTSFVCAGGENPMVSDCGAPVGTTIIIRDLFFNTPARMKFLKKDVSEGNSVSAVIANIALSHPEISFKLIKDGKQTLITPGDGKVYSAVYSVCGKEFASSLIEINHKIDNIEIKGYICKPTECRPKKNMQFVFLNGRFVKSGTVSAALEQAYKNISAIGRFPACVIYLNVPFEAVDINVHPAKTEVRFSDERRIFDIVYYGSKSAISERDVRPNASFSSPINQTTKSSMSVQEYKQLTNQKTTEDDKTILLNNYEKMVKEAVKNNSYSDQNRVTFRQNVAMPIDNQSQNQFAFVNQSHLIDSLIDDDKNKSLNETNIVQEKIHTSQENVLNFKETVVSEQQRQDICQPKINLPVAGFQQSFVENDSVKLLGEALSTYIIAEKDNEIFFIDKHAAHERMLFNQLKEMDESNIQLLLTPKSVTLHPDDYTVIIDNLERLKCVGFEIEEFGDMTVLVRSIPAMLTGESVDNLVNEIACNMSQSNDTEVQRMNKIIETISCRAAVKSGDRLSPNELKKMATDILNNNDIMYCPHGRPVAIKLTKRDIEKQFGRIQ